MWISENDPSQYYSYGAEMPTNTGEKGMVSPAMAMYPAIYYIMQPHVLVACDHMAMCGCMPSPQMMMHMCDQICDRVLQMHPDMAQYDAPYPEGSMMDPPMGFGGFDGFFDGFGRRFRRSPFRDLGFFLLLSELTRRRRFFDGRFF